MSRKNFSCFIHNLKLIPPSPNKKDKFIITSTSPLKTDTLSYNKNKPKPYTNKKNRIKIFPSFTYKGFTSPNIRYNNTMFSNNLNKSKKLDSIFPKISLSLDKSKINKINRSENDNSLLSSIYKNIKSSENKHNIKKEYLFFMKEKKSEIHLIHKNLMKRNELCISLNHEKELANNLINNKEGKNKNNYLSLTEENKEYFDNEYNNICKNKLKEKKLIEKEINNIGRQFSWIKQFNNNRNIGLKKDNIEENNPLINSLFLKRMKVKDPVLEINQASNFPIIADDKKLLSNLWKKDMMKYCEYTLDINKKKNKKFLSDLLDVYD